MLVYCIINIVKYIKFKYSKENSITKKKKKKNHHFKSLKRHLDLNDKINIYYLLLIR